MLDPRPMLNAKKVAALFDITTQTLGRWRKAGILPPGVRIGGLVFFPADEIAALQRLGNGTLRGIAAQRHAEKESAGKASPVRQRKG